MNKRVIAIILESLPIVSAPLSYILVTSTKGSNFISWIISIAFFFAFFGFVFFFIGRKLDKKDKTIKILGYFDLVATLYVIVFYTIAIFSFGL